MFKIGLIGSNRCGKTAFIQKFTYDHFIEVYKETQGWDFMYKRMFDSCMF